MPWEQPSQLQLILKMRIAEKVNKNINKRVWEPHNKNQSIGSKRPMKIFQRCYILTRIMCISYIYFRLFSANRIDEKWEMNEHWDVIFRFTFYFWIKSKSKQNCDNFRCNECEEEKLKKLETIAEKRCTFEKKKTKNKQNVLETSK